MRTLAEVKKLFEAQDGKTADELVKWYKDELQNERYSAMSIIRDWEEGFMFNLEQMNGKEFIVGEMLSKYIPNTRIVWLRRMIDSHRILRIALKTRL